MEEGGAERWVHCGRRAFGGSMATARASQTITRSSYSSSVLGNNPARSSRLEAERGEQQSISMGAPPRSYGTKLRSGRTKNRVARWDVNYVLIECLRNGQLAPMDKYHTHTHARRTRRAALKLSA